MNEYKAGIILGSIIGFCTCMVAVTFPYTKDSDSVRLAILETKVAILLQERADLLKEQK